eukprot:Gb_22747 [translate_table: standard]
MFSSRHLKGTSAGSFKATEPMFVVIGYNKVNNAGVLEHIRVTTVDGLELNFAVNVAGVYTITELLLPSLEKAAPDARVITVSSGGMYNVPLSDDLQFSEGKFDGTTQYARNKRLQFPKFLF